MIDKASTKLGKRILNKSFNQIYQKAKPIPVLNLNLLLQGTFLRVTEFFKDKSSLICTLASEISQVVYEVVGFSLGLQIKGNGLHKKLDSNKVLILDAQVHRNLVSVVL